MYEAYYDRTMSDKEYESLPNYKWTPAEITQLMFQSFNNPVEFIRTSRPRNRANCSSSRTCPMPTLNSKINELLLRLR